MRFQRIVGLLVATAAAVLMAPAAAHAETYPAEPPASTVSDGTVSNGGTVTFSGKGFLPYEKISITIGYGGNDSSAAWHGQQSGGYVLAAMPLPRMTKLTVTADANGEFSVEVPLSQVGTATLQAVGMTSGVTITQQVKVLTKDSSSNNSDNSNSGSALPTTGPGGAPLYIAVVGGAAAVFIGGALMFLARIRRRGAGIR